MADISRLEEQESFADEYGDRIAEWELFSVALICKELGRIGKMTPEQAKKFDVEKETKKTEKIIFSALTTAVLLNIKDLPKTYTSLFDEWHKGNEYMYKYRGVPFVDVADNKGLQKIINAYSKKSGAELLGFTKTKAIKVLDANGNPVAFRKQILKSFDDASKFVIEGKTDFYYAMRKSVLELGGSGARVDYGTVIVDGKPRRITRRLDTVVRQNMLYNAKMSSREYNKQIGKELGCDGIEVSFSANPRPTHRFMEGRQFCNGKSKEINGIHFDGAEDTRDAESGQNVLESLDDYNCNHRETPIICGVSEPAYSSEELARLKAENERQFTIGNSTGDGYYWSQKMRHLESEARNAKDQINALKAFGNSETQIADLNKKIKAYRQKYNEICDVTGIKPDLKRMSVPRKPKT
jgi:hypothetical protein